MSDLRSEEGDEADLAAEHAIGLLDGAGRRAAERRIDRDAGFAADVDAWNQRFAPLYDTIDPVEPPSGIWPRIAEEIVRMRRLGRADAPAAGPTGRRVSGIWQWIGLSGMGLAAASLAALILVTANLGPVVEAERQETILAGTLANDQGEPLFTVVFYHEEGHDVATLIPVARQDDGGRVPELWLVPPGGAAPRSLGVLHASQPILLDIADRAVATPDTALAISLEPPGGSPTGLPTGPVVAHGALEML
ncbi:anti-sigma factor [Aurantimonas sp. 22II-16-19i]|uniref:anti-sigma factor n=1 Tax=Aurantimonas sp. 22II-16-19i TaxID=1317114 RepID=UPI0009F7EBC5|nr:anti-sigma factor [Aurantimonas sp. 22II-16-19i]ORE87929.1 hypothetical protein ATO4_24888 [Aurantimonas sp. 22II-16-19i]